MPLKKYYYQVSINKHKNIETPYMVRRKRNDIKILEKCSLFSKQKKI